MPHSARIGSHGPGQRVLPPLLVSALASLLVACSGDVVNLGEGMPPPRPPLPSDSRCLESPTLEDTVIVNDQAQLDALEGCETIKGDLLVRPLFQPDLHPLRYLTTIEGELSFDGSFPSLVSPSEFEATPESIQTVQGVLDAGWITSFDGLDALERVGALTIRGVAAPDLGPFTLLRSLTGLEGALTLSALTNVRDLAPLAHLDGIRTLEISGPLESIDDLRLPPVMTELSLQACEQLVQVDALRQVKLIKDVTVSDTGLSDLSGFSNLVEVGDSFGIERNPVLKNLDGLLNLGSVSNSLYVSGNPLLENIDGLRGLGYAGEVAIEHNDSLTRIAKLLVGGLQSVFIRDNLSLREVSWFDGMGPPPQLDLPLTPEELLAGAQSLVVTDNPALEQLVMSPSWKRIRYAAIEKNASLREVTLGTVQAIDLLSIQGNPVLDTVELYALATVDSLHVVDNPLLSEDTFDEVQTFERQMSGNAAASP